MHRQGNRIIVRGTVTNSWDDKYDFNKKNIMDIAGGARWLEQHGNAKSFDIGGSWTRQFDGEIILNGSKIVSSKFGWRD